MTISDPNEVIPLMNWKWWCVGAIGVLTAVGLWFGLQTAGNPGQFLHLEVECRTAFDRASRPDERSSVEPSGDMKGSGPVGVVYRVTASEETAAEERSVPRELPVRLAFPVEDSSFASVPVWLEDVEEGRVMLRVADAGIEVSPGEEARVGAVSSRDDGGVKVHACPDRWEQIIDEALISGAPAAVWVVRNLGWNEPGDMGDGEAGVGP